MPVERGEVFGEENELAGLHDVPLDDDGCSAEAVGGDDGEEYGGVAVAGVFEEVAECGALAGALGVEEVGGLGYEVEEDVEDGEPGAGGGVDFAVFVGHVPSLTEAGEAGEGD